LQEREIVREQETKDVEKKRRKEKIQQQKMKE
jgi:hypothetical protein